MSGAVCPWHSRGARVGGGAPRPKNVSAYTTRAQTGYHRPDTTLPKTRSNAVIMQPELLPSLTELADCGASWSKSVLIILGWPDSPDSRLPGLHGAAPRLSITQRSEQRRGATQLILTAALYRVRDYKHADTGPTWMGPCYGVRTSLKLPSRAYGRLLHVSFPVHDDDRLHDLGSDGVYQEPACCLTPNDLHPKASTMYSMYPGILAQWAGASWPLVPLLCRHKSS